MRHSGLSRKQARTRAIEALRSVELPAPESALRAFPHQFSGGQRQRIMIALALINRPPLLIADEPTTALDAAVQSRILDLLKRRAKRHTLLMITHDLALAAGFCDRLYVMHGGRVVEHGPARELFSKPRHDYTRSLLDALPGRRASATGRGKRREHERPWPPCAALRSATGAPRRRRWRTWISPFTPTRPCAWWGNPGRARPRSPARSPGSSGPRPAN